MLDKIPKSTCDILKRALNDDNIDNFEIEQHEGNEKGQGYLGQIHFISLKNKKTGKNHHLVVKSALNNSANSFTEFLSSSYNNEIHFYTKVIPTIRNFQRSFPGVEIFGNVPKCLAVSSEKGSEKIALENLKFKNYELSPKREPFSRQKLEAIFKLYGKYHGLSYAFKHHQPDIFLELAGVLQNNFHKFLYQDIMSNAIEIVCLKIKSFLDKEGEVKIAEKFQKYVDNGRQLYINAITYKSPYSVILHGDCWSNNVMFKINKSEEIVDIKLLDFQMSMLGTPILDLTYSFYAGADTESLENLEHFLKIYHNSVSETLKQYDCDIEKSLPYEALKKEWKEYNAFGFLMGVLMWIDKNTDSAETVDFTDVKEYTFDNEDTIIRMVKSNYGNYKKICQNIVRHLYENDFL